MEGDVEGVMERPGGPPPNIIPDPQNLPNPTISGHNDENSDLPAAELTRELSREEKAEQEKYDAWASCAGLSRAAAKARYIDTLIATMRTYAYGSAEARELVNELEFVWEQVRGNTTAVVGENGEGMEEVEVGGLRVLRPRSEGDEEGEIVGEEGVVDVGEEEVGRGRRGRSASLREGVWQGQVDKALVRMTAEIAALREVMEARGMHVWRRRSSQGWLRWVFGRVWALVRRAAIDAMVVLVLYVVLRWRNGGRELLVTAYKRVRREAATHEVGKNIVREGQKALVKGERTLMGR